MKVMSDSSVRMISRILVNLLEELMVAEQIPASFADQIISKNTAILFTVSILTDNAKLRNEVLAHVLSAYGKLIYDAIKLRFDKYDEFNKQSLEREATPEPTDMSDAEEILNAILKK